MIFKNVYLKNDWMNNEAEKSYELMFSVIYPNISFAIIEILRASVPAVLNTKSYICYFCYFSAVNQLKHLIAINYIIFPVLNVP